MTDTRTNKQIVFAIILAILIFIVDINVQLGVAVGIAYMALVFLGAKFSARRHIVLLAMIGSVLTVAGYYLSPPGGEQWVVLTNRSMTLLGIWLSVWLLMYLKTSESALAESETKFRTLIESSPVCIHEIDLQGKIISMNSAGLDMMGVSSEKEVRGLDYLTLSSPTDQDRVNTLFDRAVEGKGSTFEFGVGNDENLQHFSSSFEPVSDETGRVIKLMGVSQDITDRINREQELLAKTSLLETVLESMTDGISVMDKDLKAVVFNSQFLDLLEFPSDQFQIGDHFEKFIRFNAERGDYGPGDIDDIVRQRVVLAESPKPHDFERMRPDGTALRIVGNPLPNGGFVTTYSDITERKAAEQKIADTQKQLRDAIEGLDEGFVFYDKDDRLVIANSTYKQMYPAQRDIAAGTTFEEAISLSVYAGEVIAAIGQEEDWLVHRLQHHRSNEKVTEQLLSDGRWVKVSEHRTADGGTVGIRTDITELKESKSQAELANTAKSEFLANMSHELRTPLNSIIGFSEMLKEEMHGSLGRSENKEYVGFINGSGKHLLRLIGDILDLSKIEAGEEQLDEEWIDPREIINECTQIVSSRSITKQLSFPINIQAGIPLLHADRLKVIQILLNLLSNAVKFTPAGGEIRIDVFVNEVGSMTFRVQDTGEGISQDDLETVLEPFGQAGDVHTRRHDGTGLGLALVKSLTELQGGTVSLTSELGIGTEVLITFPPERTGHMEDKSSSGKG